MNYPKNEDETLKLCSETGPSRYDTHLEFLKAGIAEEDTLLYPASFFMPSVYVFYKDGTPMYVGMSLHGIQRVAAHTKNNEESQGAGQSCNEKKVPYEYFDHFAVYNCHPEDLRAFESAMITLLNPVLNQKRYGVGGLKTEEMLKKYAPVLYKSLYQYSVIPCRECYYS